MTCKACLLGSGTHDHAVKTCDGCRWAGRRWRFLGWRPYCNLYRANRNERCIDWSART